MEHDERSVHYYNETKEKAMESKRFYEKHGALVSTPYLTGGHKIGNPKRGDRRYWTIAVRHPKNGYTFARKGYKGIVRKPRAFIVGESGPERVNVRPMKTRKRSNRGFGLGNFNINSKWF